jgi:AAA domain
MQIHKAKRTRAKLRVGLFGAAGSGKTMSALKMAHGLTNNWLKIVVIDSERESSNLYTHLCADEAKALGLTGRDAEDHVYNVLPLEAPYSPERYIEAIQACEREGYDVIIIDSISHEWIGKGGCLEIVEKVNARNDYAKWKDVTPRHNAFIDRILQTKAHVICCGRSKDDVDMVKNDKGKMEPQKVGLKAVTRDGFDFELTLCFDLDKWHNALPSKDRTNLFDGRPAFQIDETTGHKLIEWLNEAPEEEKPVVLPEEPKTDDPATALKAAINTERKRLNYEWEDVYKVAARHFITIDKNTSVNDLKKVLSLLLTHADADDEVVDYGQFDDAGNRPSAA